MPLSSKRLLLNFDGHTINLGNDQMTMNHLKTNAEILKVLGKRAKDQRIRLRMTQKELAYEADISLKTLVNFEQGQSVSLFNFIAILRSLHVFDQLNHLLPEPPINPLDYLNEKKPLTRVRNKRVSQNRPWRWGDEL